MSNPELPFIEDFNSAFESIDVELIAEFTRVRDDFVNLVLSKMQRVVEIDEVLDESWVLLSHQTSVVWHPEHDISDNIGYYPVTRNTRFQTIALASDKNPYRAADPDKTIRFARISIGMREIYDETQRDRFTREPVHVDNVLTDPNDPDGRFEIFFGYSESPHYNANSENPNDRKMWYYRYVDGYLRPVEFQRQSHSEITSCPDTHTIETRDLSETLLLQQISTLVSFTEAMRRLSPVNPRPE